MKKNHVSGLTTAAGLWVTGAIGMGVGCGMYLMAGACTFLVLFCLEVASRRRQDGDASARKALGKVIIGLAFELETDAVGEESTE